MADVQLEKGYTQIADAIIEALARYRLSGHESQCLWFIIRKTFGFQKKTDMIALSQFSQGTSLPRPKVCNALKKLKTRGLIIAQKGNTKGNIYKFNKDFDQWKSLPKRGITQKGSPQKGNQVVPKRGHTIKTLTIKNNISSQVIEYLNKKTQRRYKTTTPKTKTLIQSRLKEGFTLNDFFKVIDHQVAKWQNDPKMREYLRPETLFGTKFEGYLNSPAMQEQEDLPPYYHTTVEDLEREAK